MEKKVRNGNQLQESLRRVWWQDNKHDAALVLKRQAYGYRDMPFFKLKLLSLHDSSYPFSG